MPNVFNSRCLLPRRDFLRAAGAGALLAAAGPLDAAPLRTASRAFLCEHGFWEYVTPCTGGFEAYDLDDYLVALDDMAQAGMNSLVIMVKWLTTGYRSKLPFLDQLPGNKVIASGNRLLRRVMVEAGKRRIKVWLGAVTNHYDADKFGSIPHSIVPKMGGCPFRVGQYDPDAPHMVERGAAIFAEILDEFAKPDGFVLEMEYVDKRAPHRLKPYNAWAQGNDRATCRDINSVAAMDWFDYQTAAIIRATKAVEKVVRDKGFRGDLATINKVSDPIDRATKGQVVNLEMMRPDCPGWATINYTYDKGSPTGNYDAYMEAGVTYPKGLGLNVYYLPRGVMTWGQWTDRARLQRSWQQDIADVLKYQPQNLWWFGAGTKSGGHHTSLSLLKRMGYNDDVAARRDLLRIAAPLRAAVDRAPNLEKQRT